MEKLHVSTVSPKRTLDLIWTRVRQRGDLPGFSKVIGAILGAMRGEDEREFNMTKTVLSDPTLTQKVLRLANSPMYAVFGGGINTVSKAVIVLGTEVIGHLALGLKLVDGLSMASAGSANARAEMEKALLAGHIARQLAADADTRDTEEAVVCSMLHSLGRMMVTFYLPEHWERLQARLSAGENEETAACDVLGLPLDELGKLVALHWGLPSSLINSLQHVQPKPDGEPLDHASWLATVASMSSLCAAALHQDPGNAAEVIARIAQDYAEMLGMEVQQAISAVDSAQASAEQDAVLGPTLKPPAPVKEADFTEGKPANAAAIIASGTADICDVINTVNTAQLISMALETTYKGLGLSRAVVFLRNQEERKYAARMYFGEGVQELVPRLTFNDAYQPDVFHAALANDKIVFVENALDQNFGNKLPRWWKEAFTSSFSFIVIPLIIQRRVVGFIYGDWDRESAPKRIDESEITSLNELRVLIMQAIEDRRRNRGVLLQ